MLDRAPIGVEPDDEQALGRELGYQLRKTVHRVDQGLAAGYDGVHHELVPQVLEQSRHLIADEVVGQRNKGAGPVVDDHVAFGRRDHLDQGVEVPGVDFIPVQDVEPAHVKGLVTLKRRIDRIGVDTKRRFSLTDFELSDDGSYNRFADAPFPL